MDRVPQRRLARGPLGGCDRRRNSTGPNGTRARGGSVRRRWLRAPSSWPSRVWHVPRELSTAGRAAGQDRSSVFGVGGRRDTKESVALARAASAAEAGRGRERKAAAHARLDSRPALREDVAARFGPERVRAVRRPAWAEVDRRGLWPRLALGGGTCPRWGSLGLGGPCRCRPLTRPRGDGRGNGCIGRGRRIGCNDGPRGELDPILATIGCRRGGRGSRGGLWWSSHRVCRGRGHGSRRLLLGL